MECKIVGKYNGFTFILFPGAGSHYHSWDHSYINAKTLHSKEHPTKTNFISTLKSISQVFMYTPYEYVASFGFEKYKNTKVKYPPNKELLIKAHCKRVYQHLKKNNIKAPYILIGHSIGGFFAMTFAKLFSKEVNRVFLIDPTKHTKDLKDFSANEFYRLTYHNDMFADKNDKFTNQILEGMIKFLDTFPKDNKYNVFKDYIVHKIEDFFFLKLVYYWDVKSWNQVPDKLANHIKIVSMFDIPSKKHQVFKDIIDVRLMTKNYDTILKNNNKNYKSYFFIDRSHFLHWSDVDKVLNIIKNNLHF
ncbi:MAG: alpha/beta hydrolase [Oligoflexia bacterium]|nr:alpha/beta hydrolase [Oligoflexia bacterium]